MALAKSLAHKINKRNAQRVWSKVALTDTQQEKRCDQEPVILQMPTVSRVERLATLRARLAKVDVQAYPRAWSPGELTSCMNHHISQSSRVPDHVKSPTVARFAPLSAHRKMRMFLSVCNCHTIKSLKDGPAVDYKQEPTIAELFARGQKAHDAKEFAQAEQCYKAVVEGDPKHVPAWYHLGLASQAQGKLPQAVESYRRVLTLEPGHADAHAGLGAALGQMGKPKEAVASLQEAIRLRPDLPKAHNNLGVALGKLGRRKEALEAWHEAVRLQPDYAEAQFNYAVALNEAGKKDEAIAAYQKAIAARPDFAEAYSNLGLLLTDTGRPAEAVILLKQAVRLNDKFADAHNNLGLALVDLGRHEEAMASYEQALRLRPCDPDLHNNLGTVLAASGRLDEALGSFQLALWLNPNHAGAHWHRALTLLHQGKFEEGWQEYEWRWKRKRARPRKMAQPRWDGSKLTDKTILLYCEQGLGDAIQFVRYARLVKERVGTVILECGRPLIPLLSTCPGIDDCVPGGEQLPPHDVQAPLLSLPALLKAAAPLSMDKPYFTPDPERVALWRQELEGHPGFKIGFAWQGNPKHRWDRHRSFPLYHLLELAQTEAIQLFNLQKGHGRGQMADFPARERVVDLGDRMDTEGGLSDVAAVIASLDLIITCDSALAHLAGAMGKPVCVAIPRQSDWRWQVDRTDSPWYPSMRLFRQRVRGNWDELFERLTGYVKSLARTP
jgi:tetratricopeptide (TPR) repeat protein